MEVSIAKSDAEILSCFDVMAELRTHLKRDDFVERVRSQEPHGYQIAYIVEAGNVVSVAGFRISSNLCFGQHLYVDDLVTSDRARSAGYGKAMIEWLSAFAVESGCTMLDLDSGTHRGRAHKFYFANDFTIGDYHFYREL